MRRCEDGHGHRYARLMIGAGDRAPGFTLSEVDSAAVVTDPWREGPTVLSFFKTTCPVCHMTAPIVQALADSGCRVVAVGEDPAPTLVAYGHQHASSVTTVSEPAPYAVSDAYGLEAVPTLFLVAPDGVVIDSVAGWDRERWNAISVAAGGAPVSAVDDGLPIFRPG